MSLEANRIKPGILILTLFKYKIKHFQMMEISLNEELLISSDYMLWERCLCLVNSLKLMNSKSLILMSTSVSLLDILR